jgi:hypothetical protein
MEQIKKLPKAIISEGITLEMVNSPLFYKKSSPVMLNPGEEIVELICINDFEKTRRYWIIDSEGNYVKDGRNLFVVNEKEARIGRARYLLLYAEKERQEKRERLYKRVDEQAEKWKIEIDKAIKKMYIDLQIEKCIAGVEYDKDAKIVFFSVESYVDMLKQGESDYQWNLRKEKAKEYQTAYNHLKELQEKDDYYTLIKLFGKIPIRREKPIFVAHFDNPIEMEQCKLIFGKEAIDHWNGDMFKIAIAIYLSNKL